MSEFKTKTILRAELKPAPWGTQGYYGHKIHFTDGTKGEAYKCKDPSPEWIKAGKVIQFQEEPSSFANCPFIVPLESVEQLKELKEAKALETASPSPAPQKNSNWKGKGGWGNRYEDSPDIWLKKQIFISMLKLYEVFTPLVAADKMKYENLSTEVDTHMEHILKKSGMRHLPPPAAAPARTAAPVQRPAVDFSAKASATSEKPITPMREVVHTRNQQQEIPDVNPDDYAPTELFEQELPVKPASIAADAVIGQINNCTKLAQLKKIHKKLPVEQLKNKNIADAYFEMKNKLSKKK